MAIVNSHEQNLSPALDGEDAALLRDYIESGTVAPGHSETLSEAREVFAMRVRSESANTVFGDS